MNVEYMRTAKKSYMVVKNADFTFEQYELKMVMQNDIPCLLPFQLILADGRDEYWYEVGGMQPLRTDFTMEPVGEKKMRLILQNIMEMKSAMEEYLLDDEDICLRADMVYYDRFAERIRFCYVPGLKSGLQKEMGNQGLMGVKGLSEEILKYLDHGDQAAVRMAYEMYDRCARAPFMVSDCVDCLNLTDNKGQTIRGFATSGRSYGSGPISASASAKCMRVGEKDFSWMEDRPASSDIFDDDGDDDDVKFLWDDVQEMPGHKKKRRKEKVKKERKSKKKKPARKDTPADDNDFLDSEETRLLSEDDDDGGFTEFLDEDSLKKSWELLYRGNGVETDISLEDFPYMIGTDAKRVNGVLTARTVSRVHARLYMEDERLYVEDFNSTNGTYLNGSLLPMNTPAELKDGDRIVFATEEFKVYCRNA